MDTNPNVIHDLKSKTISYTSYIHNTHLYIYPYTIAVVTTTVVETTVSGTTATPTGQQAGEPTSQMVAMTTKSVSTPTTTTISSKTTVETDNNGEIWYLVFQRYYVFDMAQRFVH